MKSNKKYLICIIKGNVLQKVIFSLCEMLAITNLYRISKRYSLVAKWIDRCILPPEDQVYIYRLIRVATTEWSSVLRYRYSIPISNFFSIGTIAMPIPNDLFCVFQFSVSSNNRCYFSIIYVLKKLPLQFISYLCKSLASVKERPSYEFNN